MKSSKTSIFLTAVLVTTAIVAVNKPGLSQLNHQYNNSDTKYIFSTLAQK